MKKFRFSFVIVFFLCFVGNSIGVELENTELESNIESAIRYLTNHCDANGRFVYIVYSETTSSQPERDPNEYNQVRHAGALYALAQAHDWAGKHGKKPLQTEILQTSRRAARYMMNRIAPVSGMPNVLALWSPKDEIDVELWKTGQETAKLGGAGLALAGLCPFELLAPDFASQETLIGLGRFIEELTLSDGSTIATVNARGAVHTLNSLFSPGEAALGLCALKRVSDKNGDDGKKYLATAMRIVAYLAETGLAWRDEPIDHWTLLATEACLAFEENSVLDAELRNRLLENTVRISQNILGEQIVEEDHPLNGSFNVGGSFCASSTRLEGLAAAWNTLEKTPNTGKISHEDLQRQIYDSLVRGIRFLTEHQIATGSAKGGIPAAVDSFEIQVDYVQHFLSAMIAFDSIKRKAEHVDTP